MTPKPDLMKPWENSEHYQGAPTERCLGCNEPCARSPWGKWCFRCNVKRMRRINARLEPIAKALGIES